MGVYREVLTIFWKQEPHFRELYDMTDANEVILVPVMTASGYYTNTVLPRELRLDDPPHGTSVYITQPIGELSGMTDIIVEQAVSVATENGIEPGEAHLLLVGHGTRRDPVRSGATTYRHANEINTRRLFQTVKAGFLDQDPEVPEAFAAINGNRSDPVIIVPFLIASGGHGADDIPESLGQEPGIRLGKVNGRPAVFGEAAGEHPGAVNLILQAVEDFIRSRNHFGWKGRCA
jgi:sirohydrochlorin cobaltochelatase